MKTPAKAIFRFLSLTFAGLLAGAISSAAIVAAWYPKEGGFLHNLDWGVGSIPLIPFVLTSGVVASLNVVPALSFISIAGFCAWVSAGVLAVLRQERISLFLAFFGATMWAIVIVPASK